MSTRLWVDASVARKPRVLRDITNRARDRNVAVTVHAHVHLELCRHLRSVRRDQFSPLMVESYLAQQGIVIASMLLDQPIAERWAERLHERYPAADDWERAKRLTLGGQLRADFVHEPGRMPMTTDWWVALAVEDATDDRVVVDDQGEEWAALRRARRALSSDEALTWLAS